MSAVLVPALFQNVTDLGEPIQVYRSERRKPVLFLLFVIAFFYAPCVGLAFWELLFHRKESPAAAVLLIIFFTAFMFWWGRLNFIRWKDAAVVYSDGLAFFNGKTILAFRWDEIATITLDATAFSKEQMTVFMIDSYTIRHLNGKQVKVHRNVRCAAELYDQVRERAFSYRMTRSQQAFDAGEPVNFGALAISKTQGLLAGKEILPWQEIDDISFQKDQAIVKATRAGMRRTFSTELTGIHNLDVFLAIAREMTSAGPIFSETEIGVASA
jgi:hypothetical protein